MHPLLTSQHPQAGGSDSKQAEEKKNEKRTNTQAIPSNARPAAAGRPLVAIFI